ncbi:MAG: ATP-binding protein [Anaerolineae bacterium]|nr:ATP-binding protein [Anaerolineae bacterium]MDW8171907.1 ATP-binding protein [Anaerolineae bacterium]
MALAKVERQFLQYARELHQQGLDTKRVGQTIAAYARRLLHAESAYLALFHHHRHLDELVWDDPLAPASADMDAWDAMLLHGLMGHVYHHQRPIAVRNLAHDPRWYVPKQLKHLPSSGSVLGVPLHDLRDGSGVLLLFHPQIDYFQLPHIHLLSELLHLAQLALNNALEHQAVRNATPNYQTLFTHAIVPVILTDVQHIMLDVNQAACDLIGLPRAALLHAPLRDVNIVVNDERSLNQLAEGQAMSFRVSLVNAGGQSLPMLVRVRRLRMDERPVLEWVLQDLQAQVTLDKLREDMTAMIYHDLRNPIHNINVATFKLAEILRGKTDNPAVLRLLQLSLTSTRRLQRMVDSLLDLQKLEAGSVLVNRKLTEVRVMLTDAVQIVQPMAYEADQSIFLHLSDDYPMLNVDADMLLRVLINLIENALKYTPMGGRVYVGAHMDGDALLVNVRDTGPGIPPHLRDVIFDKYMRIKVDDVPRGVGLGLAFCKLAVEAHGGRIWVESEEGKGAEFLFTIPLSEQNLPKRSKTADRIGDETARA